MVFKVDFTNFMRYNFKEQLKMTIETVDAEVKVNRALTESRDG